MLSLRVRYACSSWDLHLSAMRPIHKILSLLGKFVCSESSLFWMEVLSVLDRVGVISRSMSNMIQWIEKVCMSINLELHELIEFGIDIRG